MINFIREAVFPQFGASIQMLKNAVNQAPEHYFLSPGRYYFIVYHTIVLLDYYLTIPPQDFSPVLSFSIKPAQDRPAESVGDMIPDRLYSRQELLEYIDSCFTKCRDVVNGLTDASLAERFIEGSSPEDMNYSFLEILLYNLRHVAHHVGQLHMLLRQNENIHAEWINRAEV